jgi:hypothetical protein
MGVPPSDPKDEMSDLPAVMRVQMDGMRVPLGEVLDLPEEMKV